MSNVRKQVVNILTAHERGGAGLGRFRQGAASRDQALLTNIVYGVLRHRSRIDWIISSFSRLPLRKLQVKIVNVLRVSVYQAVFLDKIPDHAIVNEAVKLVRLFKKPELSSYTNALLRSIIRSGGDVSYPLLSDDPLSHISVYYSHPEWMVKRWIARYGVEKTIGICSNNVSIPPLTIRVNRRICDRLTLLKSLKSARELQFSVDGLEIDGQYSFEDDFFRKGLFYVQDEASQLIPGILSPQKGEKILDGCAGPGGKSLHIAGLLGSDVSVTVVDNSPEQVALFKENAKRLGVTGVKIIQTGLADMGKKYEGVFDRILLDVPCSGLGVLRRRPDAKWRKDPASLPGLHARQVELLEAGWRFLKPGGVLVYSTCSTEPEENWEVVDEFLTNHPGCFLVDPGVPRELLDERGAFNTILNTYKMDYMFAVKLVKGA